MVKCEYYGCENKATVRLKSVKVNLCTFHLLKVALDLDLITWHEFKKLLKKKVKPKELPLKFWKYV